MSEIETLKVSEQLGRQAETFKQSDLGRYLDGAFEQDIDRAKEELLLLDPYEYKSLPDLQVKIASIQRNAHLAMALQNYISEVVTNGQQATHQLESNE
jgi:hypothetical protein